MSTLSRNSGFNALLNSWEGWFWLCAQLVLRNLDSVLDHSKQMPEMPEIPQWNVMNGLRRLWKIRMLRCIDHMTHAHPLSDTVPQSDQAGTSLAKSFKDNTNIYENLCSHDSV